MDWLDRQLHAVKRGIVHILYCPLGGLGVFELYNAVSRQGAPGAALLHVETLDVPVDFKLFPQLRLACVPENVPDENPIACAISFFPVLTSIIYVILRHYLAEKIELTQLSNHVHDKHSTSPNALPFFFFSFFFVFSF